MKILTIIPARGGSKGLPGKNILPLCGKPLICYAIDIARSVCSDEDICVSSDDQMIIKIVEEYGLRVPFVRPAEFASDTATTNDVLLHAVNFYKEQGKEYDVVLLLQPTSPLRTSEQIKEAVEFYDADCDMVVSVKKSHAASVMCHQNEQGWLVPTLTKAQRRQDAPDFFEYNGAIYVINVKSLMQKGLAGFNKERKYIMPEINSIDIDTKLDFDFCEHILNSHKELLK